MIPQEAFESSEEELLTTPRTRISFVSEQKHGNNRRKHQRKRQRHDNSEVEDIFTTQI